jgi:hypothetical protein
VGVMVKLTSKHILYRKLYQIDGLFQKMAGIKNEKWAFAISAKEEWKGKAKGDVKNN